MQPILRMRFYQETEHDDMHLKTMVPMALLLATACPAAAEPATPPAGAAVTAPTMFTPVSRSLQQLITDGYQVVNIAVGLSGFGYLLKQDNHYVTCAVQPDPARPNLFVSECRAMN